MLAAAALLVIHYAHTISTAARHRPGETSTAIAQAKAGDPPAPSAQPAGNASGATAPSAAAKAANPSSGGASSDKAARSSNGGRSSSKTTSASQSGSSTAKETRKVTGGGIPRKGPTIGVRKVSAVYAHGVDTPPAANHPHFLDRVIGPGGIEYGTTRNNGVFVSTDHGKTWAERSDGLSLRVIYPFKHDPISTLTSIGVDPSDGKRVAVTTAMGVFLSKDAGRTWKPIPIDKAIRASTYITAVALSPFDKSTIAVGTSFRGYFVTNNDGKKWSAETKHLGFLYRGAGFYEEVAAIAYSPRKKGEMYLGIGFGGEVYRSTDGGKQWNSTAFPGAKKDVVRDLNVRRGSSSSGKDPWILHVSTQRTYYSYDPATASWKNDGPAPAPPAPSPAKQKRMAEAANRAGIYISPWQAAAPRLGHWISFLKKNGLNTLVVDVKDDHGHITYNSQLPFAHKIGAVHPYFNIQHLIKVAHENGIYVIGRLVVFKDKYMYRYDHHRYAIWDPQRNAPWGYFQKEVNKKTGKVKMVQKEFWVDPFAERVWRYNVNVAKELQRDGINEIQFDYIRFPSQVTTKNAVYRFRRKGMTEEDALESFLRMARAQLKVPISVDIFGYNGWYPNAGWVGQDIEVYANYADVVSPMYYPSLFPRDFLPGMPYLKWSTYLYRMGTWRAKRIVDGRAVVRPFVQAFLLGPYELKMDKARYTKYLRSQLKGAQEGNSSGFLLWNFGTDYYMVTFPLTPYVKRPPFALPGAAWERQAYPAPKQSASRAAATAEAGKGSGGSAQAGSNVAAIASAAKGSGETQAGSKAAPLASANTEPAGSERPSSGGQTQALLPSIAPSIGASQASDSSEATPSTTTIQQPDGATPLLLSGGSKSPPLALPVPQSPAGSGKGASAETSPAQGG